MAEKNTLDKLEEHLTCAICFGIYKDPKVLQCSHVYCRGCLEQLALQKMQEKHSLTCPNCRKLTLIPENGVKDLQPAFQINNMLDIKESLKKDVEGGATGRTPSRCHDHVDEELKLYCKTCKQLICCMCINEGAKHHKCNFDSIDKLSESYKEEISTSLKPTKENLTSIGSALEKLEIRHGEISDQRAIAKDSVQNTIKRLHEALELRQTELIELLELVTSKKLEHHTAQTERVKAMQTKLEQFIANTEEKLEKSDEQEVVKMKTLLIRQIEEANTFFQPDILKPRVQADIKFAATDDVLTVACRSYGKVSANEMLPDPLQCYATGPGLATATAEEVTTVIIQAVNFWGTPCEIPTGALQGKLVSEINSKNLFVNNIRSSGNRSVLKYTPIIKGGHQLHITIDNQHIRGSPFAIRVTSTRIETQISTIIIDGVDKPWGVAINHKNEIIVTEHDKHCVSIYRPNGEKLLSFGEHGSREGQFNHPRGVAVDHQDNILVTDYRNNRIQKFAADGTLLAAVGSKGSGSLQFKGPQGIAFNSSNNRVYVVDENRHVQVLNPDLSFHSMFGEFGIGPGQLSKPWGIGCDRLGKVYVTDQVQHQIQVFRADGTFSSVIGNFGFTSCPFGIAITSNDMLLVSDRFKQCIYMLKNNGDSLGSIGSIWKDFGTFKYPRGVAVDSCGVLFVCDNNNNRICLY